MSKKLNDRQIWDIAKKSGIEFAMLKAFIQVESGGKGFADNGKLIIQFEPHWFQRYTGNRIANGVEGQTKEWEAFNKAFGIDKDAAMMSTSIGLMQVMGFHYKSLGFKTVGDMWDFAKISEANQVELAVRFIKKNKALYNAILALNYDKIAYYYNGELYKKFNYHNRLKSARESILNK